MKKSDLVIIAIGIVIIAAIFAAITYIAFAVNAANAGLHGGF
jgi:flagellar basal body-associated protein FliL